MDDWQEQLKNSITSLEQLSKYIAVEDELSQVLEAYEFSITPYYASLIDSNNKNCPIKKQAVPDIQEITHGFGNKDPLLENQSSPTSLIIHLYPDRVAFLVSGICAMYCRHCLRKYTVKMHSKCYSSDEIKSAIAYIKDNSCIRDVLLTGGDPLMLSDDTLEWILSELRAISHVEIIRIGTRMVCTLPQRITDNLCRMIKKYHPIWLNTQFNHVNELTFDAQCAINKLLDSGVPIGNQSVLLKGINDSPENMLNLLHRLVKFRIRPYYIYQAQTLHSTTHFITPIETGLQIMKSIRGYTSGICEPKYVLDTPFGKVPIDPTYSLGREGDYFLFRTYNDNIWREYNPIEYNFPHNMNNTAL